MPHTPTAAHTLPAAAHPTASKLELRPPSPSTPASPTPSGLPSPCPWLFSRTVDLWAFGGSTLLAFLGVAVASALDLLDGSMPLWAWVAAVLAVDVAHVHATWFRVYLEPDELRRRPMLYIALPLACYAAGVGLHTRSSTLFWTVLAYVAVFHFVRQPFGWVAMYRARAGDAGRLDRWIDTAAIYAATLWPLLWWHGQLPRSFVWFVPDDFIAVPRAAANLTFPLYAGILGAFVVRQAWRRGKGRAVSWGKALVVATTTATWYIGIVALNSDLAFTLTNVLPHGIPYLVLVWWYGKRNPQPLRRGVAAAVWREGAWLFVALVVAAAFLEELVWDRAVWHERPELFGGGMNLEQWHHWIVPLLVLPQLTHYVLDGFIWRRRSNPELKRQLEAIRGGQDEVGLRRTTD